MILKGPVRKQLSYQSLQQGLGLAMAKPFASIFVAGFHLIKTEKEPPARARGSIYFRQQRRVSIGGGESDNPIP